MSNPPNKPKNPTASGARAAVTLDGVRVGTFDTIDSNTFPDYGPVAVVRPPKDPHGLLARFDPDQLDIDANGNFKMKLGRSKDKTGKTWVTVSTAQPQTQVFTPQAVPILDDFPPAKATPKSAYPEPVWDSISKPEAYLTTKTPWLTIPLATMAQNGLFDAEKWAKVEDTVRLVESAGGMLCGGWFAALAYGSMPADFDFYFRDGKSYKQAVEMVAKLANQQVAGLDRSVAAIITGKTRAKVGLSYGNDGQPSAASGGASAFDKANMFVEFTLDGLKIQLIKSFFEPNIEGHLDKFDLTIAQFGLQGECVVCSPQALADLKAKQIRLHATHDDPAFGIKRIFKYQSRGYELATVKKEVHSVKKVFANPFSPASVEIDEPVVDLIPTNALEICLAKITERAKAEEAKRQEVIMLGVSKKIREEEQVKAAQAINDHYGKLLAEKAAAGHRPAQHNPIYSKMRETKKKDWQHDTLVKLRALNEALKAGGYSVDPIKLDQGCSLDIKTLNSPMEFHVVGDIYQGALIPAGDFGQSIGATHVPAHIQNPVHFSEKTFKSAQIAMDSTMETARGAELDRIGRSLGVYRRGRTDEEYRKAIENGKIQF